MSGYLKNGDNPSRIYRPLLEGDREFVNMKKIILFISISLFGYIGWWLGANFGIMTAYLLSLAGSLVGVVVAVKFNQKYLG
jgi:uncharacterized membrane protein SpoIIM required for sporulation